MVCWTCSRLVSDISSLHEERFHGEYSHLWLSDYSDIKRLIQAAKYAGDFNHLRHIAEHMARLYVHAYDVPSDFIITSIPSENARRRKRGYDHAAIFAQSFSRAVDRPYVPTLVQAHSFVQNSSDRIHRIHNPRYLVTSPIPSPHALILDDVATTRSSLRAARVALCGAGVTKCDVMSIAYTKSQKNFVVKSAQRAL